MCLEESLCIKKDKEITFKYLDNNIIKKSRGLNFRFGTREKKKEQNPE